MKYSAFSILREGLRGHRGWAKAWHNPTPKDTYDVVIIGGGGHGLATAYYLAKNHGVSRVAVIEKGWLGGGNTGRNTTAIRSNYFYPQSTALYDLSVRLYEDLSRELNYNVMFSQRGIMTLAHSEPDMEMAARQVNAMQLGGVDAELLNRDQVRKYAPLLNFRDDARFPIHGATWQGRAGTGRHDAVAWGYARAADSLGVDIIQNCAVTGVLIEGGVCKGVETSQGLIRAGKVGAAVAGHSTNLADMAGYSLPIHSYALQAFVSEPVKPVMNTVALSPALGVYFSQSDKGGIVVGGGLDRVPSYGQRGNTPMHDVVLGGLVEMAPILAKVKLLRHWGGIVDVTPDSSPIIGPSPVPGLYLNCGWGTGGFKAIPAGGYLFAHLLARDSHHEISRPFDLDRFQTGHLIDESAASGIAH
ncbi:sarcosine oxidase subunit beta family protein [Yoonia sediminilitoris]|uniref:Sarcosine oxidase subunit beta n=1 Tax=Yoonia sediminilitoris TaxID=1286148 RepID=A0A2T6KJX5_9RHOB|nr:sarcosine oxidase subunit beta family protein [Yoonia sediminilitoris]PUB16267.1 sarcosine oxidase subunit beta [Yoonia sediminilitoris]RCW96616.1 sarcosine oxidase subunit beta [Yoonia sediminilitoris]